MIFFLNENSEPLSLKETICKEEKTDYYFTILDFTDHKDIDIVCFPLGIYEIFTTSVAEIQIGRLGIAYVPLEFHILIGDRYHGNMELVSVYSVIDKEMETPVLKPIKGFHIRWEPIDVVNIHEDLSYVFPVIRNTHLLAYPVQKVKNPYCIFVGNKNVKQNIILDIQFFMQ